MGSDDPNEQPSINSAVHDTGSDTEEHGGPPELTGVGHVLAQGDPIEEALADALHRAARDRAWDAVQALTDEIRARRAARAGVVAIEDARAKRDGKR